MHFWAGFTLSPWLCITTVLRVAMKSRSCFLSSLFVDKDTGSEKLSNLPKVTQLRVSEFGQDVCLPSTSVALSAVMGSVA